MIELIAVMAIMAIATAMVLPNIRGMISKTEESKYQNYCISACSYVKSYVNLLILGETSVGYEVSNGKFSSYDITSPDGMRSALNEYNLDKESFQYHVLSFAASSAKSNPSTTITELIEGKTLSAMDVIVVCIVPINSSNTRVQQYRLEGVWFYSYEKESVVYSYYAPSKIGTSGYQKLTKNGK